LYIALVQASDQKEAEVMMQLLKGGGETALNQQLTQWFINVVAAVLF
jgi:hypothetical protein